ncbi:MAG: T9SS type A sorting domain-containing protein [Ignavibacteriales bacterium]|nr:T9SS type A sorting domain-containing protein [Ignavibacteriales bacterium]
MPNLPAPYMMRDWKSVAKGYDSLVFKTDAVGDYLPLNSLYSNTVNYPGSQSFRLKSYVGSPGAGGEGINCLPAVVGAELVGLDKRNQNGKDWVAMCKEWFNTLPSESVYLNTPRASSGDDWWYETMPNIFFYQLYDLHPEVTEFKTQSKTVADRWLAAVKSMNGSATPWHLPNMDHRAWELSTMTPNDIGVHEPEAAGAIGWLLYQAFVKTGDEKYRIGAEWAMEFLSSQSLNPSYELQLVYGAVTAARMNAEMGTMYDLQKIFNWCFDVGPLRSWGTTLGTWGNYDCYGLVGDVQQFEPGYAFLMNTFQHVGALAPIARYDDRYARAIGKWVLNAANAVRLLYPNFLPDSNQDSRVWSAQYDPHSFIGYEGLKQTESANSALATGDAMKNGWAATNLALYGSSHVGYLAAIVDTTNVPMVLQVDLLKTDFGHAQAYPTFLFFNPHDSTVSVALDAGNDPVDLYDLISNTVIKNNVTQQTTFEIPQNSARVLVLVPSGGTITYSDDKMLINDVVVDYRSSQSVINHSPRIKAVAASKDTVLRNQISELFCTAEDRDGDPFAISWITSHGIINGSGAQVTWTSPDSAGLYSIICTVKDSSNAVAVDTVYIFVVESINHQPTIQKIRATPRKLDLNSTSTVICLATDIDPDTVYYSWSASCGSFTGSVASITWNSPSSEGNYTLYCSVSDGHGGIAKDSISVEVRDFSKFVKGNILAYYPFNGNANDASGNNRNGAVVNAQLTSDRNGMANSAFLFDGATSSIKIPNDNGLSVQNAIALNFWMKIGAFYNREQYPISHGNWMNRWKISISNGRIRWTVKTSTGIKDLDSETQVVLDSVYNITVVYNGMEMELYLNGELDAFAPFSGTIQTTTIDLTIGQSLPTDNNYNFNGVLDDIRVFDYGLSVDEIAQLSSRVTTVGNLSPSLIPTSYAMNVYPNPFNPSTITQLSLPAAAHATVRIFDLLGRETATILDGFTDAGVIETRWDAGRNASGIYFCVATFSNKTLIQKLVLVR